MSKIRRAPPSVRSARSMCVLVSWLFLGHLPQVLGLPPIVHAAFAVACLAVPAVDNCRAVMTQCGQARKARIEPGGKHDT